jgi:hypothetical protein
VRRLPWALGGLLVGLLIAGVPAAALPPRSGLCDGLTGDGLTRCLYSELDDRLRANGMPPAGPPSTTPTATATPPSTPTPSPSSTPIFSPTPSAPADSWLSGASGPENANGTFGTWRGSSSEIAGTWVNSTDLWSLRPGFELGAWSGAVDVAGNVPEWQGWAAEANGVHDNYWRAFGQSLKKYRAGKGTTYLRIYHEYNGDWYPWSVKNADRANFVRAWERTATILRTEFPQVKMMLGAAAAGGNGRIKVADAWPAGVDVLSVDWYNEWPWCNTDTCVQNKIERGAGNNSLAELQRLARTKGVPILISEWGNAARVRPASSGGGGDAPAVMQSFYTWVRTNAGTGAGEVLGEVYFNIGGYDARFELFLNGQVSTMMPQTAAKYRELWRLN